jgi:undecaprenyl-diphosphatase
MYLTNNCIFKYIFLGFVQGLTEFLPVSSSGHLTILKHLLGVAGDNLSLNISLHSGTLMAVFFFFWHDIRDSLKDIRLLRNILASTIITGLIAVLFKGFFESLFDIKGVVSTGLFVTSIFLLSTYRRMAGERKMDELNILDAGIVGLFQAIAIVPGISRSGATISTQLWRGIEKNTAFRYSFLISIPAVSGALVMELPKLKSIQDMDILALFAGFLAAFFTGLIALKTLFIFINKLKFHFFGFYCLAIAILTFFIR